MFLPIKKFNYPNFVEKNSVLVYIFLLLLEAAAEFEEAVVELDRESVAELAVIRSAPGLPPIEDTTDLTIFGDSILIFFQKNLFDVGKNTEILFKRKF